MSTPAGKSAANWMERVRMNLVGGSFSGTGWGAHERLLCPRHEAQVTYREDSGVPWDECSMPFEYSKLFAPNGYYKYIIGKRRGEDKASATAVEHRADTNADAAVAYVEDENSTGHHNPEGKKKPETSHSSGSPEKETSEQRLLPVAEGFTLRNRVIGQAKQGKVKNWTCVNFSCMGDKELRRFLYKLRKMCLAIGVAFYPHPTMFIHSKSVRPTDIEDTLLSVHRLEEDERGLLIVILPDDEDSHAKVKDVCENLGFIYQCCLPTHARRSSRQYMKNTACVINKAIQRNTLFDSRGEQIGSDKETEDDGPELRQLLDDSDVEMGSLHSHSESGCDGSSEICIGSDEETQEGDSFDEETGEDEGSEQLDGSDELTSGDDGSKLLDGSGTRELDGFEDNGSEQLEQMGEYVAQSTKRKCVHHCDVQVKEVKGKVKNWACVSFSHMCRKETFRFLDKLKDTCVAIGMDFFPMPTRFVQWRETR